MCENKYRKNTIPTVESSSFYPSPNWCLSLQNIYPLNQSHQSYMKTFLEDLFDSTLSLPEIISILCLFRTNVELFGQVNSTWHNMNHLSAQPWNHFSSLRSHYPPKKEVICRQTAWPAIARIHLFLKNLPLCSLLCHAIFDALSSTHSSEFCHHW